MNFNAKFPNWMRFCLLQGFYTPGKSHALNGRIDSTPRILTFKLGHFQIQATEALDTITSLWTLTPTATARSKAVVAVKTKNKNNDGSDKEDED